MIFALALCFCGIATVTAWDMYYPGFYPAINITPLISVTDPLVVIARKHDTNTTNRCHSTKQKESKGDNKYTYILRARKEWYVEEEYISGEVEVTVEGQGNTSLATYTDSKKILHTITLLENDDDKCFVIKVVKSDGKSGCELLTKVSSKDEIPDKCKNFFENKCGGDEIKLYVEGCKYDFTS